jgi:hypothetical protein
MNSKERSIAKDKAIDDTLAEVKEIKLLLLLLLEEKDEGESSKGVKKRVGVRNK